MHIKQILTFGSWRLVTHTRLTTQCHSDGLLKFSSAPSGIAMKDGADGIWQSETPGGLAKATLQHGMCHSHNTGCGRGDLKGKHCGWEKFLHPLLDLTPVSSACFFQLSLPSTSRALPGEMWLAGGAVGIKVAGRARIRDPSPT